MMFLGTRSREVGRPVGFGASRLRGSRLPLREQKALENLGNMGAGRLGTEGTHSNLRKQELAAKKKRIKALSKRCASKEI